MPGSWPKVIGKLVVSLAVCQLAGVLGSVFTFRAIAEWYDNLIKPAITPPNWLFGPVWTTLYLMMGLSLFLLWHRGLYDRSAKLTLLFFAIQLALNALWSFIFFGLRAPAAGAVEITVLWAAILLSCLSLLRISKTAGLLMVPYLLWVSFAAVLNFMIWVLNR